MIGNFQRLLETASMIENNLSLFNCICKHVDTVTTIIEYLTKFYAKLMSSSDDWDAEYSDGELLLLIMFTLFDITNNFKVNTFLQHAIIKNSYLEKSWMWKRGIKLYHHMKTEKKYRNHMIVLQDSDLHAVIDSLKTSNHVNNLEIIWLHELIESKFISLIRRYSIILSGTTKINKFQFKEEVTSYISNEIKGNDVKINIVSIWSEDITTAESLAKSLNANVVFINAYMNFYGNTVLLPYLKLLIQQSIYAWCFVNFDDSSIEHLNSDNNKIYNLYYDGIWQKPIKDLYWTNKNELWADASRHDYFKCLNSAKKGFEIWRTTSIDVKIDIISNFISTLNSRGETELAKLISEWKVFAYLYKITSNHFQKEEAIQIREPRGIILLNEKEKDMFFYKLMLTLISGNTVIVIFTADYCFNPTPFFDMFAISKIPPGVINLLSSSNKELKNLESSFCETNFGRCSKESIFIGNKINEIMKLTTPMQIIVRIK